MKRYPERATNVEDFPYDTNKKSRELWNNKMRRPAKQPGSFPEWEQNALAWWICRISAVRVCFVLFYLLSAPRLSSSTAVSPYRSVILRGAIIMQFSWCYISVLRNPNSLIDFP